MKRILSAVLMLTLVTGCSKAPGLENQAHAVTMGIDIENDSVTVTIQSPSFSSKSEGGEKGNSGYHIYKASGKDFQEAYSVLCASVPQEVNLSQLKTIVFSEAFSKSESFLEQVGLFVSLYSLSKNAIVCVSMGKAADIIENQKPYIGMRLSRFLSEMLEYREETGYIPLCTLSMLYAGMNSFYSTSVCAYSANASDENQKTNESYLPGEMEREGENKNEYIGCALFNREKMAGILNGRETQLLQLLRGEKLRNVRFYEPFDMIVTSVKSRDVSIDIENGTVFVKIDVYLEAATVTGKPEKDGIEEAFEEEFMRVIDKCRSIETEPFGLAEIAAARFLTFDDWNTFDWLDSFQKAEIEVNVHAG